MILFSVLAVTARTSNPAFAQSLSSGSATTPPSPLATTPTPDQQQALQNVTPTQIQTIQSFITPQLQPQIQNHQQSTSQNFRSYQEIISSGTIPSQSSAASIQFTTDSGVSSAMQASMREHHPASGTGGTQSASRGVEPAACCHPVGPTPDLDQDGLPDNPTTLPINGGFNGDLETALAKEFLPSYFISSGEQQQFATFGNYVPWTVINNVGTNPPNSYYHVSPLGVTQDQYGNQIYAVRLDYLSLWNADGGLVGGGAACFYSYFGLDAVINQLSGHDLDAERSLMLLAAPSFNGSYNPDPSSYKLYSLYTGAHEGTFFDQSMVADFSTPVPSGNHVNLAQSLSKHSTYGFDPNYYPLTPPWFIYATIGAIDAAYAAEEIDAFTYAVAIGAADDTFYGCLVEQFGNKGGGPLSPISNVGEVAHPLNGNGFIQDDSTRALHLASKLNTPIF